MHAHTYSPKLTHQWWFFLDKFYVTFSSCLLTCTSSSLAMTILLELIGKKKRKENNEMHSLKLKNKTKQNGKAIIWGHLSVSQSVRSCHAELGESLFQPFAFLSFFFSSLMMGAF